MTHHRHYKHLHIPPTWEQYWSKYPNGYSIMESLIDWVSQTNKMIESFNNLSDEYTTLNRNMRALEKELRASWKGYKEHTEKTYTDFREEILTIVNQWIATIEPTIQDVVVNSLSTWLEDGTLADIINEDVFNMKANQSDLEVTNAQLADMKNLDSLYFDGSQSLPSLIVEATQTGRRIKVPAGTYVIDEPIVVDLNITDLQIEGEGATEGHAKTRLLWRGGQGTMFTFNNARRVIFKDIEITGFNQGDDIQVPTGITMLKTEGSIETYNAVFMGFDVIVEWNGGYYHKFNNTIFKYFKLGFKGFNANNLIFKQCRIFEFESLIAVNAGEGPVVIDSCSIERWTKNAIEATSGSAPLIKVVNSYIENYIDYIPGTGLDGDFKSSNFIVHGGIIDLENNAIVTNGIKRVVHSNEDSRKIISKGNRIRYKEENSTLEYYIYKHPNVETVHTDDYAWGNLIQDGQFTPVYISSVGGLKNETSYVYDAFEKKRINIRTNWVEMDLENGWSQTTTAWFAKPSYKKEFNRVRLKGSIVGADSTSDTFFTLPVGSRPSEILEFATTNSAGTTPVTIRIRPSGSVESNQNYNNITISGIEFEAE